MQRAFLRLPFAKKIMRDNIFVAGVTSALALLLFLSMSFYLAQQNLRTEMSYQASTLAANLAGNTDARFQQALILNSSHSPSTTSITVYDDKGIAVTHWNSFNLFSKPVGMPPADLVHQTKSDFHWSQIDVASPMMNGDEIVGLVFMSSSLTGLYRDLFLQGMFGLLTAAGIVLLCSYYLTEKQLAHLAPVFEFAKVADHVVSHKDYSARMPYDIKHELGSLGRNFNQLVSDVETWEATREAEVRERDEDERRLNILNNHDSLTKLPNRHYFHRLITNCLEDAVSLGQLAALIFIDLDHLKDLNDEYGYDAGDLILATMTNRLISVLRSTDTLCRVDGDEFAAILPEIESAQVAANLAERLTLAVRHPMTLRGKKVVVTASIGIACCPLHGKEQRLFLHHTDLALRAAKAAGGNTSRIFNPAMAAANLTSAAVPVDVLPDQTVLQ